MQCQKQIAMIATLVREMPLAEYLTTHPSEVATVQKLLELQKMLPPSPVHAEPSTSPGKK